MRMKLLCIAGLATLLAGCGQAIDEAADAGFDAGFTRSCVEAARASQSEEVANSLCSCALTKINAQYSTEEKQALTPEEAMPLMQECIGEVGIFAPEQN